MLFWELSVPNTCCTRWFHIFKIVRNISLTILICQRVDQPPPVRKSDDYEKYNIAELEKKAVKAAKEATLAYTAAINELKGKTCTEVLNVYQKNSRI